MLDKTRREIDSMLQAALDEATACRRDWEEVTDAPERFVRAAQARENTAKRRLQRFRTEVQHDTQNWGEL
jgi:hypothetical protein